MSHEARRAVSCPLVRMASRSGADRGLLDYLRIGPPNQISRIPSRVISQRAIVSPIQGLRTASRLQSRSTDHQPGDGRNQPHKSGERHRDENTLDESHEDIFPTKLAGAAETKRAAIAIGAFLLKVVLVTRRRPLPTLSGPLSENAMCSSPRHLAFAVWLASLSLWSQNRRSAKRNIIGVASAPQSAQAAIADCAAWRTG